MTHTIGRQNHNDDSYLDVTSVDDVKDKTFLSGLAGWLRREQPITLSINADPSVDGCVSRSLSVFALHTRSHMLPPCTYVAALRFHLNATSVAIWCPHLPLGNDVSPPFVFTTWGRLPLSSLFTVAT
jgi:hypothetical protein